MKKYVFVDSRVSDISVVNLESMGYVVVRLPSFRGLLPAISSHPDILMCSLSDDIILTSRSYYNENVNILHGFSEHIVLSDECPHGHYPGDVLFDSLKVGTTLYGRMDSTSRILKDSCKRLVNVRQGYARCSVAMLSENCAITADHNMFEALTKDGIDVLKIRAGYIELPGLDYGFIGGAGGRLENGLYAFFGDVMKHPDGKEIIDFAEKHKIKTVMLDSSMLSDHGGLLTLNC